jgi:hypothetical protein
LLGHTIFVIKRFIKDSTNCLHSTQLSPEGKIKLHTNDCSPMHYTCSPHLKLIKSSQATSHVRELKLANVSGTITVPSSGHHQAPSYILMMLKEIVPEMSASFS